MSGLFKLATSFASGPKPSKTFDPAYTQAKCNARLLLTQVDDSLVGHAVQWEARLGRLARATCELGKDLTEWFSDAPPDFSDRATTVLSFGLSFEHWTLNFLEPRMSPYVTGKYSEWQKDVKRLPDLILSRRESRKRFDLARQKLEAALVDTSSDSGSVSRESFQVTESQKQYNAKNSEFIALVDKLMKEKAEIVATTSANVIGLMAQYGQLVFTDMQKFRTTFDAAALARPPVHRIPGPDAGEAPETGPVRVAADGRNAETP
jgi:hypothetical protein